MIFPQIDIHAKPFWKTAILFLSLRVTWDFFYVLGFWCLFVIWRQTCQKQIALKHDNLLQETAVRNWLEEQILGCELGTVSSHRMPVNKGSQQQIQSCCISKTGFWIHLCIWILSGRNRLSTRKVSVAWTLPLHSTQTSWPHNLMASTIFSWRCPAAFIKSCLCRDISNIVRCLPCQIKKTSDWIDSSAPCEHKNHLDLQIKYREGEQFFLKINTDYIWRSK